jgi:sugar lactone lactonase YvrE
MKRWFLLLVAIVTAVTAVYSQAQIQAGYAVLTGNVGTSTPVASALFTFSNPQGIIVSQAGVGSAPPVLRSRIFVDERGTRTGIALANATTQPATISMTLRDSAGASVATANMSLNGSEHRSRFVDELFTNLPPNFTGSVTFDSNQALSAITLRERKNSFNEPLYATLPVVDLTAAGGASLVFPHLAAGDGYVTQLILFNRGAQLTSGTVRFFAPDGSPLTLRANSANATQLSYTIAADGVYQVELDSSTGVKVGYATLTAATGSTAPAGTVVFRYVKDNMVVTEAAVASVRATTLARIYVDYIGSRTGVAIANSSQQSANVTFSLLDRYGVEESTNTLTLAAGAYTAKFADELFPNVADGFTGLMEIQSTVAISPITLKLHVNSRFDQVLTTLPVADLTAPASSAAAVLPQIAIGLGFSTRLILLHPGSAADVVGQLKFVQSDGTPMILPLSGTTADNFQYQVPVGNGRQFYPGSAANVSSVSLIDPVTGQPTPDLLLSEGVSFRPRLRIVDSAGIVRDDFEPTFQSSNTAIAVVDSQNRIRGVKAGFSTIIINVSGIVVTAATTVTNLNTGITGFNIVGVAQDLAKRLYLVATQDHTVLRADDLTQAPVIYAGIQRSPGLKNDAKLLSQFRQPSFIALDATEGSLYLSDSANHVIRRIRPGTTEPVETIAGTGVPGSQDGPAATASFNNPQGVSLDGRGFLWIVDSGNHTIRRLNLLTRVVETIAGKAGTPGNADGVGDAARFQNPTGVAVVNETTEELLARELSGAAVPPVQVVIADTGNDAIRSVDATGVVATFTDTTSSALRIDSKGRLASPIDSPATVLKAFRPTAITVDASGNLYFSESGSRVRAILRTGSRSTSGSSVTITSSDRTWAPQSLFVAADGQITIGGTTSVRQIQVAGPAITAVTPDRITSGVASQVIRITGSNFDLNGTRVSINGRVQIARIVDSQTVDVTVSGVESGSAVVSVITRGGNATRTLTVDPAVANSPGTVATVAGSSNAFAPTPLDSATILTPAGLALGPNGIVYVVERLFNRVRKIDRTRDYIVTAAGNGIEGFSGDGRGAAAAMLNTPTDVAVDSAGNLFIADTKNNRIRRVDSETGVISTVAGTGTRGFAGDGGPARGAVLNWPDGLAFDASDNLFIADSGNNRIRKVTKAGIITTVAGNGVAGFSGDRGPALNAALNLSGSQVHGLAVDRNGSLFISDTGNNRIRVVNPTGTIFTYVGTTITGPMGELSGAAVSSPAGLSYDPRGFLYIADMGNHVIKKVDAATGDVTVVAGTGTRGFAGDGQLATLARFNFPDAVAIDSSGNVLISDQFNFRIRQINARTQTVITYAGRGEEAFVGNGKTATDVSLGTADGVAVDSRGTLFIADRATGRIRRVDSGPLRIITTIAGNGTHGLNPAATQAADAPVNNPAGVAVDASGNVYFADIGTHRIRKVDVTTGVISTIAGSGRNGFAGDNGPALSAELDLKGINNRMQIAFDAAGNLYFTDVGNNRIRRVDSVSKNITTVAGNGQQGFAGDGGPATAAALSNPTGLAIDGGGNIFIADSLNHRVRRVDATARIITTWAGSGAPGFGEGGFAGDDDVATAARFSFPSGLAFDTAGNLFIADLGNSRVRRVNGTSLIIQTVAGTGVNGFSGDGGLAVEARFNNPSGVAVDASGNLYIADTPNHRIRMVRGPIP